MRGLLFLLTLVLAACGGNGDGFKPTPEPLQHVPAISNLKLTPDSALYMEGDGSIVVTAEFAFTDLGQDIQTLQVKMSDGTSLEIPLAESVDTVSGSGCRRRLSVRSTWNSGWWIRRVTAQAM
jgi:hypothetical protein